MLPVLFLLGGLGGVGAVVDLQPDGNFERLRMQVIVPEKIESIIKEGIEAQVSYKIAIDGKSYTMKLTQKNFLPHNFKVYGYDNTGIMKPLDQQFQSFCYYQGYVEDYPNSLVMASTCTGIRGLLQFENVTYGIEPLESSLGFEHVIYQVKYKSEGVAVYAERAVEFRDAAYAMQSIEQSKFPQYIEMHIVVEKQLYDFMGSDTAGVTQKIFQLIGLTNALWVDENKMNITGDANELLYRFLKWKRSFLVLRPHDVAFLLVYREIENYVGATFQGKMCDRNYGGGVALHPKTKGMESLAIILAQLLSLNMGIPYDDVTRCQCQGAICVMNPEAVYSSGMKSFSNCSVEEFTHFISKQKSNCLQNQPRLGPSYKQAAVCGNSIVEEGEICDCGSQEKCNAYPPVCCDAATCTLVAGSTCWSGTCCENCQFKNKGTLCRSSFSECDLQEYCNGSSNSCPDDVHVIDGHPCEQDRWICMSGTCRSGQDQCLQTFDSDFGTDECFEELNSKNDISGNCGSGPRGYTPCAASDRKCGKLICQYKSEDIVRITDATIIYANVSGKLCVSLDFPHDHEEFMKMWVLNGTVCGREKICRNKACVNKAVLNYDCTPQNCNNNGVCNSKRHCHCSPPYLPPNCNQRRDGWPGGSVDSGNLRSETIPESYYIDNSYRSKSSNWPYFLMIPFFIILCVLIAILMKVHAQRKKWRMEDYISDEQLESSSESKE